MSIKFICINLYKHIEIDIFYGKLNIVGNLLIYDVLSNLYDLLIT